MLIVMDLASPDTFLYAFEDDKAILVPMDRAAYHRSIFLDARISPAGNTAQLVPWALLPAQGPPPAWIFHVAHCGSTLLARALDDPEVELVLREPLALRQAAVALLHARAGRPSGTGAHSQLALVAGFCGRRYGTSGRALVKANVPINFVIDDLLVEDRDAPVILLYFPLADYLAAIMRGPNHRAWLRGVTDVLKSNIEALVGVYGASDAERAGALWLAQLRAYAAAQAQYPKAFSLDANTLFNAPRLVIEAAAELVGRPICGSNIDAILSGALFTTYSKNPAHIFDNATRLARCTAVAREITPEIAAARAWIAMRLRQYPLPDVLIRPLVGNATPLL